MITEPITWHVLADNPADLPDADTTVLIEIHPDEDYSEPVFMGALDDDTWRDVHGEPLHVVAWADPPAGTRQSLAARSAGNVLQTQRACVIATAAYAPDEVLPEGRGDLAAHWMPDNARAIIFPSTTEESP
jgi:hypothetical protein